MLWGKYTPIHSGSLCPVRLDGIPSFMHFFRPPNAPTHKHSSQRPSSMHMDTRVNTTFHVTCHVRSHHVVIRVRVELWDRNPAPGAGGGLGKYFTQHLGVMIKGWDPGRVTCSRSIWESVETDCWSMLLISPEELSLSFENLRLFYLPW